MAETTKDEADIAKKETTEFIPDYTGEIDVSSLGSGLIG